MRKTGKTKSHGDYSSKYHEEEVEVKFSQAAAEISTKMITVMDDRSTLI